MSIHSPKFLTDPEPPQLTDEEIMMRVNAAIEEAKRAGKQRDIYVDLGITDRRRGNVTANRAIALCSDAGWTVGQDGRSGYLILNPAS